MSGPPNSASGAAAVPKSAIKPAHVPESSQKPAVKSESKVRIASKIIGDKKSTLIKTSVDVVPPPPVFSSRPPRWTDSEVSCCNVFESGLLCSSDQHILITSNVLIKTHITGCRPQTNCSNPPPKP